jgi:uncharacterized surface protein with fasciclin (FAS1) repeats
MVSIGPYTEASDYRQMYDFVDLRDETHSIGYIGNNNTIMGIIENNPDFTIFSGIVKKAGYIGKLMDPQSDFTVFVASDYELKKRYTKEFIETIDKGMSIKILDYSMMNRKIDQYLLQSSPVTILPTLDRSNSMHIDTICGITKLSNNTKIIHFNHPSDNGIIHVIDNLLIPYNTY